MNRLNSAFAVKCFSSLALGFCLTGCLQGEDEIIQKPEIAIEPRTDMVRYTLNSDSSLNQAAFRSRLMALKTHWQAHRPPRYRMEEHYSAFSPDRIDGEIYVEGNVTVLTVRRLTESNNLNFESTYPTFDSLFQLALNVTPMDDGRLVVTTDSALGYISAIHLYGPPNITDVDWHYTAELIDRPDSAFPALPSAAFRAIARANYQERQWRKLVKPGYSYTLNMDCFCAWNQADIEVQNDSVIRFQPLGQTNQPQLGSHYTVPALFDGIRNAAEKPDLMVEYDIYNFYPKHISYDLVSLMLDSGIEITVGNYKVFSAGELKNEPPTIFCD
jgi:hypothetical protein